jgi:hypothetical protein
MELSPCYGHDSTEKRNGERKPRDAAESDEKSA